MRKLEHYLHGVNLGGWLSQNSDTSKEHYETFITEKDIAYIASLGLVTSAYRWTTYCWKKKTAPRSQRAISIWTTACVGAEPTESV